MKINRSGWGQRSKASSTTKIVRKAVTMLRGMRVKNFKSFVDSDKISIKSINILAGANSSGKSSLIQAILLVKQTMQYGAINRPVAPNGPLLRLGSLSDVRSTLAKSDSFELSFDFSVEFNNDYRSPTWQKKPQSISKESNTKLTDFTLTVEIGSRGEFDFTETPSSLMGDLLRTRIDYVVEDTSGNTRNLFCEMRPTASDSQYATAQIDQVEVDAFRDTHPEGVISNGYVEKLLPDFFFIEFNSTPKEVSSIVDYLTGTSFFFSTHEDEDKPAPTAAVKAVESWAEANRISLTENMSNATLKNLKGVIELLLPNRFSSSLTGHRNAQDLLRTSLRDSISELLLASRAPKRQTKAIHVNHIYTISRILDAYFKEGVRYLGPLREPPKPVSPPEALESFTEVGYRGEHTAAVIDNNKKEAVIYIRPPGSEESQSWNRVSGSLKQALTDWLRYLGVAQDIETRDMGVYGNRMQVTTEMDGTLHDLTHVGVGVSQVLPIIVSTLLAPPGSMLIFEQPELHLHPKVQSRLADFIISAARLGKQIILETHSEYIIDRVRLRIAEDEGEIIAPLINILFLEQLNGSTKVNPIDVNEYGVIANWPSDFFDQSEKDSASIIYAARRKRKLRPEGDLK